MNDRQKRTPAAEATLRRAHDRMYEVIDDPEACYEQFAPIVLAFAAPGKREEALQWLRETVDDEQLRIRFVIFAYKGTLTLYSEGAFDDDDENAS